MRPSGAQGMVAMGPRRCARGGVLAYGGALPQLQASCYTPLASLSVRLFPMLSEADESIWPRRRRARRCLPRSAHPNAHRCSPSYSKVLYVGLLLDVPPDLPSICLSRDPSPLLAAGVAGTGKTALAASIARSSEFPFIRLVSPNSMLGMSELTKSAHVAKVGASTCHPLSVHVSPTLRPRGTGVR